MAAAAAAEAAKSQSKRKNRSGVQEDMSVLVRGDVGQDADDAQYPCIRLTSTLPLAPSTVRKLNALGYRKSREVARLRPEVLSKEMKCAVDDAEEIIECAKRHQVSSLCPHVCEIFCFVACFLG